jgi:acetyl esterase/lipase
MTGLVRRRAFLKLSAVATLGLSRRAFCGEAISKRTYTYKTVGGCDIKADVYGAGEGAARPVLVWIHGGALIMGSRAGIDPALRDALVKAGFVVVSIDYRLAPETKLPDILDDVRDACRWVRRRGPELFSADPARVAVAGASAGGYLTLTTGYRVEPRPRALASFWGYGDVAGAWYSRPDPFYRRLPLVTKEDAEKAVGGPVLSESSGKNERQKFYLYCRQQGLWPREVAGLDPDKEPKAFDPFCPVRNVGDSYPMTLLIHGTKDTDVPYEQSEAMAGELARHGVVNELITVPDAGHGLAGARPELVARVYDRAVEFLRESVR